MKKKDLIKIIIYGICIVLIGIFYYFAPVIIIAPHCDWNSCYEGVNMDPKVLGLVCLLLIILFIYLIFRTITKNKK